mgnify:FL=1
MAKKLKGLEGIGPQIAPPSSYDDSKYYDVKLASAVEYPPASRRFLMPSDGYIELRGRVANAVSAHISEAREVISTQVREPPAPPARTNLTSVKAQ